MDYIQQLEWRNYLLQSKVRILNELKNYIESADSLELSLFVKDLGSIYLPDGRSLKDILFEILSTGKAPQGWNPFRYFPSGPVPPPPPGIGPQVTPPSAGPLPRATAAPVPTPTPGNLQAAQTAQQVSPQSQSPVTPIAESGEEADTEEAGTKGDEVKEEHEELDRPEIEVVQETSVTDLLSDIKAEIESKMVEIKGGSFMMGSEDGRDEEKPVHKVNVSSFKMCAYLITNRQYRAFILDNPEWQKDKIDPDLHDGKYLDEWDGNDYPEGRDDYPVSHVSWFAAEAFASWLGKRLPTEAEWEYAARGGLVGKKYPNGDKMNEKIANLAKRYSGTTPVGQFEPNGYGLYDMAGNLFEWTADWYAPYRGEEQTDPKGPSTGEYKVIRGGSWISSASTLRVSFRIDESPERCGYIGIRLAE